MRCNSADWFGYILLYTVNHRHVLKYNNMLLQHAPPSLLSRRRNDYICLICRSIEAQSTTLLIILAVKPVLYTHYTQCYASYSKLINYNYSMRPSVGGSAGQNNHIFSQTRGRRRDKVGWVTTTERYGRERLGSLPRPRVSKPIQCASSDSSPDHLAELGKADQVSSFAGILRPRWRSISFRTTTQGVIVLTPRLDGF